MPKVTLHDTADGGAKPGPRSKVAALETPALTAPAMSAEEQRARLKERELAGEAGGNLVSPQDGTGGPVRRVGDILIRTLDHEAGRLEITYRLGRILIAQRLTELERFDLFEVFGATTPNPYTIGMASLAASLRSITTPDGQRTGRVFPKNVAHIRGALTVLGDAGVDALRKAFAPSGTDDSEADEDAQEGNEDGSVELAKN